MTTETTTEPEDTPYPWWKAKEDTWVPKDCVPIKVADMTETHVQGVVTYLNSLLAPAPIERLRWQMFNRYCGMDSSMMSDHAADGADEFAGSLADLSDGGLVSLAYPAALAIVARAKTLGIRIPSGLKALESYGDALEKLDGDENVIRGRLIRETSKSKP